MDGDGSIQVNHWRSKNLQYRLIIKLKYNKNNYNMLLLIKNVIGGNVNILKDKSFVIWVVNNKKDIIRIINIFKEYPLLTSSKQAQLNFLKLNLKNNNIDWYLKNRNLKYSNLSNYQNIIKNLLNKYKTNDNYTYFDPWLSGFIEVEGCFSLRLNNNNHSFSISQNNDLYLLEFIKDYFNATNNIREIKKLNKSFYLLEIYKKSILNNIINHCNINPLLGFKYESYYYFYKNFNK